MKRIANFGLGLLLLAASFPFATFAFLITRNILVPLRSSPSGRSVSYGIGRFEFAGWQMYAFPIVCSLVALLLIVVARWVMFLKDSSAELEEL